MFAPVLNIAATISWKMFPESVPKDIGAALAIGFVLGATAILARIAFL